MSVTGESEPARRRRPGGFQVAVAAAALWSGVACAVPPALPTGPIAFDTATAWIRAGADSVSLLLEIAETTPQQERGLAGRASLDEHAGMLFTFDAPRTVEDGFWMWGTAFPLDVAFLDEDGVILQVLGMATCTVEDVELCPGYFPERPYAAAIETNLGWFARNGVGVGARVRVVR